MFSTNRSKNNSSNNFDRRIADAASDLKARDLPPALRENVVYAFRPQQSTAPAKPRVSRRLVIGAATVVVGGASALLSGPRFTTTPVSAASIVDAIQSTNTWHFSGWRLVGGKKVPWEIWGRRAPFFYREQIGDEIVTDDGQTRHHLLPPQRMHPKGFLLIMPTQPLHTRQTDAHDRNAAYDTTAFLEGTSGDYRKNFTLKKQDSGLAVLESSTVSMGYTDEQVQVAVDQKTRLPIRYVLLRTRYKTLEHRPGDVPAEEAWAKATLRAEYNVPLPLDVLQGKERVVAAASEYQTIDLTMIPNTPTGAQYGMVRKEGITVVGETLNRDEEGNLRLKYQVWLGNVKTGAEESHLYPSVTLLAPPFTQFRDARYTKDNNGVAYLDLNAPDADTGGRLKDYRLGYLATSEPSKPGTLLAPGTLIIPARVRVAVHEDDAENGMNQRTVAEEEVVLTIPLPAQVSSLEYDRPRPQIPGLNWKYAAQQQSLRLAASWQRGVYWSERGTGRRTLPPGPVNRAYLERAKQEYHIALAEAERAQNKEMIKNMTRSIASVKDEWQEKW